MLGRVLCFGSARADFGEKEGDGEVVRFGEARRGWGVFFGEVRVGGADAFDAVQNLLEVAGKGDVGESAGSEIGGCCCSDVLGHAVDFAFLLFYTFVQFGHFSLEFETASCRFGGFFA